MTQMGQCFTSSPTSNENNAEDDRTRSFNGNGNNACTAFGRHSSLAGITDEMHAPMLSSHLDKPASFCASTPAHVAANKPRNVYIAQANGGGGMRDSGKLREQSQNSACSSILPYLNPTQVLGLYDYESRSDGDITFKKGDLMRLIDKSNSDWWYVENANGQSGYVPRTYVALHRSAESEEWFAGMIPRSRAERLVSSSNLPSGTFLIRQRENDSSEYALTIRDSGASSQRGAGFVKHYKIRQMDQGYYITTRSVFATLKELVAYYSERSDGLCCQLTFPAPRIAPTRPDLSYNTHIQWEIPRNQFILREKLGDGNFGEVWHAMWQNMVDVAIKTMKPGTMSSDAFLDEARIMKHCDHINLVKLYGVCTTEEPFYIITEFMSHGSLLHYLRDEKNELPTQVLIDMCTQVANGMKYLEERKLVHRDLAARNVLVGEKVSGVPIVKVADFGLARKLMEEDIYEAKTGAKFPIKWTAPEAATSGNFTVKSDVWSYGILLYEIFTRGQVPYPAMHNREVIEQVEIGYRMSRPAKCPQKIFDDVMIKCWDKKPDRRPTFAFLYSFFDDYFVSSQNNYIPQ